MKSPYPVQKDIRILWNNGIFQCPCSTTMETGDSETGGTPAFIRPECHVIFNNSLPDARVHQFFYQQCPGTCPLPIGILLFPVLCTGIHHTCVVKYVLQFVIYTFAYVYCNGLKYRNF